MKRGNTESYQIAPRDVTEGRSLPLSMIEDEVAGLERIASRTWRYHPTLETLNLDDVLERFADQLHPGLTQSLATPDWLKAIRSHVHVRLVETQRLVGSPGPSSPSEQRMYRHSSRNESPQAVSVYSRELTAEIQLVLAESAELSQNLDSSFPRRVINQISLHPFTTTELRKELDELEQKRTYLFSTGLLDSTEAIDLGISSQIDDEMVPMLSVYVTDAWQKLAIFDDIATRIDLLTKMINDRFLYKDFEVSRERGFLFEMTPVKMYLSLNFHPVSNISLFCYMNFCSESRRFAYLDRRARAFTSCRMATVIPPR